MNHGRIGVSLRERERRYLIKRVMMFVDGGYLRRQMEDNLSYAQFLGDEEKSKFEANLEEIYKRSCKRFFKNILDDLIRIYYYDGISDDLKHEKIRKYHEKLRNMASVHVKTIQVVKSSKEEGYKQKGIDTLIAIDMLSKAYENHYDVAFLLTGDKDLEPVVNAVKDDAGKNVYGIYFNSSYSDDLKISFDKVYEINKEEALGFLM